jgi:putative protease
MPELLAPAGTYEKLVTAVHYGADAVYLGGKRYSLREKAGNFTDRLALMDESRTMPVSAVWNQFCLDEGVPAGSDYLSNIHAYESEVLSRRS